MRATSQGFVDYERMAGRYQEGRSLPAEVLDRWRRAVQPLLPPGPIRVADVGAGTGIFAEVWPQWAPATVVAVEPSPAMIRAGAVTDPAVGFVRAVAELLPFSARSLDVIWVSTALHHFSDVELAVAEFARVLRPGGRVLVRTYAPGRSEVSWAEAFPGRAKWSARFQTEEQLATVFGSRGFVLSHAAEVLEWTESYAKSAAWVERMRHADSVLTALSDEEIAVGLETLRATPAKRGRMEVTLFVFELGARQLGPGGDGPDSSLEV